VKYELNVNGVSLFDHSGLYFKYPHNWQKDGSSVLSFGHRNQGLNPYFVYGSLFPSDISIDSRIAQILPSTISILKVIQLISH